MANHLNSPHRSESQRALAALALLVHLPLALCAQDAAAARRYYDDGRRFERLNRTDQAIAEYRRAIDADPRAWRYSYQLGEVLLGQAQRYADALDAYRNAWDKGYRSGITRHKIGECLYWLGSADQALEEFERAADLTRRRLDSASGRDAAQQRFNLANTHLWISRVRLDRREYEAAHLSAVTALNTDSGREIRGNILDLGGLAFGWEQYDLAARLYALALQDVRTGAPLRDLRWDDFPDWRIPTDIMLEVVENRRRLGRIEPEYTHAVLALLILDQDVEIVQNGEPVRIHRVNAERQRREAGARLRWLKQVLESLSDGRYSLSFEIADDSTPYRYSAPTRPDWIGDRRVIAARADSFDTLIRLWPYGEGLGTGGATGLSLRPARAASVTRGAVSIHAEHSYGMWIHEFFHVVESMARISPTHGYYDEQRGSFPGWTGRKNAQLDYFRWHFRTTLPPLGWANLNFRVKYSVRGN